MYPVLLYKSKFNKDQKDQYMARFDYNTTYPLRDVMAASVMAYRINDDQYVTHTIPDDTWNSSEQSDFRIKYQANKHLMLYSITDATPPATLMHPKVNYYFDNVADDEDFAVADEIISYYTGLMFKAIGGKINEFEERVLALVKAGEVRASDFGIVASLPKSYYRSLERDRVEEQQRELSDSSEYVGTVGQTVDLDIEIMRFNYIQKLNCYVVNAQASGNLVVFFTSNEDFNGPDKLKIRGRVKRHQTSNYHGGKESVLNYVKRI